MPRDVDLKEFAKFLKDDPAVYPEFRSLKNGDKPRAKDQMDRAVKMNLKWADKIDRMFVKDEHKELTSCP